MKTFYEFFKAGILGATDYSYGQFIKLAQNKKILTEALGEPFYEEGRLNWAANETQLNALLPEFKLFRTPKCIK